MTKQFETVDCSRGAPLGRCCYGKPEPTERVRLFKVRLDSGGYDDGGAYWGFPSDLYCAQGKDFQLFTRANSRKEAAEDLGILHQLKIKEK